MHASDIGWVAVAEGGGGGKKKRRGGGFDLILLFLGVGGGASFIVFCAAKELGQRYKEKTQMCLVPCGPIYCKVVFSLLCPKWWKK